MPIETTTLNPQVIFVSATEPSDKTEGKLWYGTNNNELKVSNGSNYVSMEQDVSNLSQLIQENAVNILVNSAGATTNLNDWDEMILDTFSDADGYLDTIDTTNTTSYFDTDSHSYKTVGDDVNVFTSPTDSVSLQTVTITCTCKTEGFIKRVDVYTAAGSPTGTFDIFIKQGGETLASKTEQNFKDNNAKKQIDFVVEDYTDTIEKGTFTIELTSSEDDFRTTPSQSYDGDSFSFSNQSTITSTHTGGEIHFKNTEETFLIQTNVQTITAGVKHVQIYSTNTTTEIGSITASVSLDNGSTYTTDIPLNTKTAITSTDGTQFILKLNQNRGSDGSVENKNYAVMLFY